MNIELINLIQDEGAPPMNLVYIGSYLKKNGFTVKLIDSTYEKTYFKCRVDQPQLIGISSMTAKYNMAVRLARQLKKNFSVPVIIGGAHISSLPGSLSKDFDVGVIGEGEETTLKLCRMLKEEGQFKQSRLSRMDGIAYWSEDGKLNINNTCGQISDLDNSPIPEFNLLHRHYYKKRWIDWSKRMGIAMHISTSRGCPYDCVFCSSQKIWPKTRFQSAWKVFGELKELTMNYKVDHIVIDDDLFLADKRRLEELADLIESSEIVRRAAIYCSGRANLIDDKMCRILKRIGVKAINFGFESGSDRILKSLKGGSVTVGQNKTALELCRKYGFEVSGNLILGSPGEGIEDMQKTLQFMDFAIAMGCYKMGVFLMTPLPGTPMWDIARERGRVNDKMNWDRLNFYNYKDPLLLDGDVDKRKFEAIFKTALHKSYHGWLGGRWWRFLKDDFRRTLRKTIENPRRSLTMFFSVFTGKK